VYDLLLVINSNL